MPDITPQPATDPVLSLAQSEPLALRAIIGSLVTILLHLAVSYGAPIDGAQEALLVGAVDLVGLLVTTLWARRSVTANAGVVSRVNRQGELLAGEAATLPTDTQVPLVAETVGGLSVPLVAVKPELVTGEPTIPNEERAA